MRITVIGATGHVGTYLVPMLVQAGHEVTAISRGARMPYAPHPAWRRVTMVKLDRAAADAEGALGGRVLASDPEAVIDMICYSSESAGSLVETLRGRVRHLLVCGTLWIHGPSTRVPLREDDALNPFGDYGTRKLAMSRFLQEETRRGGLPTTVIHPGHIVGPGWPPLNPEGHFDTDVFRRISCGEEILVPNNGMETVHHVHAEDVARLFISAMDCWSVAAGESFHAASDAALSLRGYAEAAYRWWGHEANIKYLPWKEWESCHTAEQVRRTWDHIAHSPCASMEKARRLLGFAPRWPSLDAVRESVGWLEKNGFQQP